MRRLSRRTLLSAASVAAAGAASAPGPDQPLRAKHVKDYLWSLGDWFDRTKTVDTFKAGDPETEVKGIAVGWMSYTWALRRAAELGCNLFVTHEPTYYDHFDRKTNVLDFEKVRAKQALIEDSGVVILRCHDMWDQYPKLGIPDAWAQALGFSRAIAGTGFFRVFDVAGRTALDVARQVARQTKPLGQEAVQLLGPPDAKVHRVAIGCGAITPFQRFLRELEADMAICTDDGFTYWRDGALAIDLAVPVVVVNHPVAEEPALALLAGHLMQRYPHIPVHAIPQKCMYRIITA